MSEIELETHCPHPKCGLVKEHGKFACRPHWFQLPQEIRKDISRGWKYDRKLWLEARNEAIEFWKERIRISDAKAAAKINMERQLSLGFFGGGQ